MADLSNTNINGVFHYVLSCFTYLWLSFYAVAFQLAFLQAIFHWFLVPLYLKKSIKKMDFENSKNAAQFLISQPQNTSLVYKATP